MTCVRTPLVAALAGFVALSACTDSASLDVATANPNQNRNTVLNAGAIGGAALIGAAVGAATDGIVGNELDKHDAELRQHLANDGITVTNAGDRLIVTLPQEISFDVDSAALRPSLQADLDRVAANLLQYPKSNVEVIGHTDNTGDAAYNLTLSQERAFAVQNVLLSGGVPSSRVSAFGRGETQPIASNLTPEGRAQNRRVDIVIVAIPKNS